MPRPASENPRRAWVSFRVTDTEQHRLERHAEAGGFPSVSEFVRAALFATRPAATAPPAEKPRYRIGKDGPRLVEPSRVSAEQHRQLMEQIRRAGVNLNQIAHHLNEGRLYLPGLEPELRAALDEVRAVVRQARAP